MLMLGGAGIVVIVAIGLFIGRDARRSLPRGHRPKKPGEKPPRPESAEGAPRPSGRPARWREGGGARQAREAPRPLARPVSRRARAGRRSLSARTRKERACAKTRSSRRAAKSPQARSASSSPRRAATSRPSRKSPRRADASRSVVGHEAALGLERQPALGPRHDPAARLCASKPARLNANAASAERAPTRHWKTIGRSPVSAPRGGELGQLHVPRAADVPDLTLVAARGRRSARPRRPRAALPRAPAAVRTARSSRPPRVAGIPARL